MAFKMKGNPMQRNFPSDMNPSPHKIIRLGISKRVRKFFGSTGGKKGYFTIDRRGLDLSKVGDFFKENFGKDRVRKGKKTRKPKKGGTPHLDAGGLKIPEKGYTSLMPSQLAETNVRSGGSGRYKSGPSTSRGGNPGSGKTFAGKPKLSSPKAKKRKYSQYGV